MIASGGNEKMLNLDWCNICWKPEWLPEIVELADGCVVTKEEFLELSRYMNYYDQLCHLLPELRSHDDFVACSMKSGNHYSNGMRLGYDFFIYWDDKCTNKGLMMEFPSHGLQRLYDWFGVDLKSDDPFYWLCLKLWEKGCRFSRVDICKDVKKSVNNIFTPSYLCELYLNNQIVTHLTNKDLDLSGSDFSVQDARFIDTRSRGSTFYLGSLKNRRKLLRVYDKEAELGDDSYPYWRWEIELHGDYARKLQERIVYHWSVSFADLIDAFCYVVVESDNEQRRHREVDIAWQHFRELEFCEEIPSGVDITPKKGETSIEKKRAWEKSIAPAIASILWIHPEDRNFMIDLCDNFYYFASWCKKYNREDLLHDVLYYRPEYKDRYK